MPSYKPSEPCQVLFRKLLAAMSRPGRFQKVDIKDKPSQPNALVLNIAQCLIDHEVAYAVAASNQIDLAAEIGARTGAVETDVKRADFIFVHGKSSNGLIQNAKRGTQHYPDLSATVIYYSQPVEEKEDSNDRLQGVRLSGPGIKEPFSPPRHSLLLEEFMTLREVNADYPLGVDSFILRGNDRIMALPRSTRIEVM